MGDIYLSIEIFINWLFYSEISAIILKWLLYSCFIVILFAVSAVYFAGVMVRLMLTLTPVVCILAAIGFSTTLDNYLVDKDELAPKKSTSDGEHKKKKKETPPKKESIQKKEV